MLFVFVFAFVYVFVFSFVFVSKWVSGIQEGKARAVSWEERRWRETLKSAETHMLITCSNAKHGKSSKSSEK